MATINTTELDNLKTAWLAANPATRAAFEEWLKGRGDHSNAVANPGSSWASLAGSNP